MPDDSLLHRDSLKRVAQTKLEDIDARWHARRHTATQHQPAVKAEAEAGAGAAAGAAAGAPPRAKKYPPATGHPSAVNDAAAVKYAVKAAAAARAAVKAGSQFDCDRCIKPTNSGTLFHRHESTASVDTHYYSLTPAGAAAAAGAAAGAKKMCGPCGNKTIVLQAERPKWELLPF